MSASTTAVPKTKAEWLAALNSLPSTPDNIPAFFFSHGSPALVWPENVPHPRMGDLMKSGGPKSPLAQFLAEFGPTLLEKYQPKGILVFSAHWESEGQFQVTDYGNDQPLLMDYYGFHPALYELKFKSRGDSALSNRVVELFEGAGLSARTTKESEPRGEDGRGYPGPGLDHGVFVPFRIMFGNEFTDVPIVEATIDGSLDPEKNWKVGQAVAQLRKEGILILAGGLMVHTFQDFSAFSEDTAKPIYKEWHSAILSAVQEPSAEARKKALIYLVNHKGFRKAHPREEHFVPLYVGAGAGDNGEAKILDGTYGTPTFAFGL
ncbi:Extradiol ring-cleavage dioxygenase, class III enzyme, subunit B [Rickenella mellea]|uniref:Extradiol ring-cleavage dioxygenase, class III enzyme, subunit B n=1 Tax=Rickenella mellea TaxID=50990 RepID=A0A4Y7QK95_9AGAM|nr:Extradiol ring-cleavage dioxygenase, class III enzyme, subunit B [Rickenella mellea]